MIKPLTAAISGILLAYAVGAPAQDASANGAAQADANTTAPKKSGDDKAKDAVNLQQVIVTGTRSPKAIDEIPGAITVVSKIGRAHV